MKPLIPAYIFLYIDGGIETLDGKEIVKYLGRKIARAQIELQNGFVFRALSIYPQESRAAFIDRLARRLASIKVRNPMVHDLSFEPVYGEIEYERRRITNPQSKSFGILYDGFELQLLFRELIPQDQRDLKHAHIIITHQLIGTWDEDDLRYHARVGVYGVPSIISATGLVEAPAKPRDFYLLKQQLGIISEGDPRLIALKRQFKGRFIDYGDERLTEVLKGCVMQALFWHMTGEAFCEDKYCRLYNAHWQEDLIEAQLSGKYEFCERHAEFLSEIKSSSLNEWQASRKKPKKMKE